MSINRSINYFAVIMAGGVGSRFFPVSTPEQPKQFHDMLGTGKTLIQQTFDRIHALIPSEHILVSTNNTYRHLVLEQLPQLSDKQLVVEPVMRNTAPAILYSALKIFAQNPDAIMLVAPSDHWIDREDVFIDKLNTAFTYCSQHEVLLTMGIMPTYPNTGYGYIQFNPEPNDIKKVNRFTEKPDVLTATQFLKSGDYLWNAGIFVWSVRTILKAFEQYLPKTFEIFEKGKNGWNTMEETTFIQENYPKVDSISIDFAILEKAPHVVVIPVDMGWNDLGTWGALYQKLAQNEQDNAVLQAQCYAENSKGNIIRTEKGKKVILKNIDNLIIVEKDNILMILPKDNEQDIKDLSTLL